MNGMNKERSFIFLDLHKDLVAVAALDAYLALVAVVAVEVSAFMHCRVELKTDFVSFLECLQVL